MWKIWRKACEKKPCNDPPLWEVNACASTTEGVALENFYFNGASPLWEVNACASTTEGVALESFNFNGAASVEGQCLCLYHRRGGTGKFLLQWGHL